MRTNKAKSTGKLMAAALGVLGVSASFAAAATWTGANNGEWGTGSNWTGGTPNAAGVTADINTAVTINVSDTGTSGTYPYTVGTIATNIASGNVVIGNNTITTDVLTLSTTSGSPTLSVTNSAANIFIYANLEGTQGFTKTGAGRVTFRFNGTDQNFTGNVTLGGGTLGIERDRSLGNVDNDIVFTANSTLLTEPGANSGTITLLSTRSMTVNSAITATLNNGNAAVTTIVQGAIGGAGNLTFGGTGTLELQGANSYGGSTTIAGGGTLRLGGGNNRLPTTTTVSFTAAGKLDLQSTSQSIVGLNAYSTAAGSTTVSGSGGSLTLTGNADFGLNTAFDNTLDMSGLSSFTYNQSAKTFQVRPQTTNAASYNNAIYLAKTGVGTNNITAATLQVGAATGTSQGTAFEGRLYLGLVNNISASTVNVGGFNGSGLMAFQTAGSVLTLRGTSGGAVTLFKIGNTSSGARAGKGVVDLTNGSIDALVTELVIGRNTTNLADTSAMTISDGTLTASQMTLGDNTAASGTTPMTNTFTQGGGTVAATTLTLGQSTSTSTGNFTLKYNLNGGILRAGTIKAGDTGLFATTSTRQILWTAGTIANLDTATDLSINGVTGTGGTVELALSGSSAKSFSVDPGRTITIGTNASITGTAAVSKGGAGTLLINGTQAYGGTVSVAAGTLQVDGTLSSATFNLTGGTVGGSGRVGVISGTTGAVNPGAGVGILSSSNVTLGGASLQIDVSSNRNPAPVAGTQYDQLNVTGAVDLTGSTLSLNLANFVALTNGGEMLLIIRNDGTDGVTGTFTNAALENTVYTLGGNDFMISYHANAEGTPAFIGGNDVALVSVPEPATLSLAAFGLAALLKRRRKHNH